MGWNKKKSSWRTYMGWIRWECKGSVGMCRRRGVGESKTIAMMQPNAKWWIVVDGLSPMVQLRKWRTPSQGSSQSPSQGSLPSEFVARIVAVWVRRKYHHRLSPSQGSLLSESVARIIVEFVARIAAVWVRCKIVAESVARIVAIWVRCKDRRRVRCKDRRCLSPLQGSSPYESVVRNCHWLKTMDRRKDRCKDRRKVCS